MKFSEKTQITYKGMNGSIVFVGDTYFTFTPFNSKALILVYKEDWKTVTVL